MLTKAKTVKNSRSPKSPKKPKINPYLLKAIAFIFTTLIAWLLPEAPVAIALIKLLFFILEYLNQKRNSE
ncbi:hypothetical protein [Mastigocoleus sp. MO_188.B34]|uniref:hypothetical protein n=1 Tax=Mastigocoleus sp. MO_188.B34 TaxID=3036635 RepID=UPI002613CA4C|nr:hypothetical protein [Mastigocoleus sp. MO_188.B34]MDJ0693430.1 hypothetical protein [Mastigocoleus sp. MO_188.B34]